MGKELGDLFNCPGCMAKCQDQEKEAVGWESRGGFKRQMCAQNLQEWRRNAQLLGRFRTLGTKGRVPHLEIRRKGCPRAFQKLHNENLNVDEGIEKPCKLGQRDPDGQESCNVRQKEQRLASQVIFAWMLIIKPLFYVIIFTQMVEIVFLY